jgi:tetratricopeptide (TPR) repeat protein
VLALAGFLARNNRLAEALDRCDAAWETCEVEAVAGTCVAVLRSGQPTPEQFARAEGRLREAIKKQPRSTTLLLQLADLQDARGQFGESEALYRQALDREPRDFVAANNLAWLLAQRAGQAAEALRLIDRAIEIAGPKAELLDTRATVYLAQGRAEQAVADLEVATRDAPSGDRFFRLARAYQQANNPRAASTAWRKAKDLNLQPDHLHPAERVAYQKLAQELDAR